jgi:hypothetical protein
MLSRKAFIVFLGGPETHKVLVGNKMVLLSGTGNFTKNSASPRSQTGGETEKEEPKRSLTGPPRFCLHPKYRSVA